MSGETLLLTLHGLKAWTGKTLPLLVLTVTFNPICHITR